MRNIIHSVGILILIGVMLGLVAPVLVSAADTVSVILGFIVIIGTLLSSIYWIKKVFIETVEEKQ